MASRLTALDATFLELEQADASAHMHIGAVLVFGPAPGGDPPSLDAIRERLSARLDALPRFRERLSHPQVGGGRFPCWEADEAFDLAHHVRRAALPAPGGTSELLEWAGEFYSHRLDRARPLWELVLLEGLPDGRWALATKTHHALVDGVGSVDAASVLLDDFDAAPRPARREPHGGVLGALLGSAHVARHPVETLQRSAALADLIVRDELVAAPHTSLNVPMGKHRRLATVGVPLEDLKAIKRALGGTVNDAVLAAVTGGLRALLLARGETPPGAGLRAMVPVNVRPAGDGRSLGNRISSLFVTLPVDEADPLRAYLRVRAETSSHKLGGQVLGSSTLLDLAGLAPPLLHAVLSQAMYGTRLFNVTVTNVPGPQEPMYAFGARLLDGIPLVPLAAEHSVGVAILSLDGQVVFCLNCDRDAVPDVHVAAQGIAASLEELGRYAESAAIPQPVPS
jgi:diacylglycerol O-acyltransferase / wax synthase